MVRKCIAFTAILIMMLLAITMEGYALELAYIRGDVNGGGAVDNTDARMMMQHEVGLYTLSETQQIHGDLNGDRVVDSTDARLVLQYEVGLYHGVYRMIPVQDPNPSV